MITKSSKNEYSNVEEFGHNDTPTISFASIYVRTKCIARLYFSLVFKECNKSSSLGFIIPTIHLNKLWKLKFLPTIALKHQSQSERTWKIWKEFL